MRRTFLLLMVCAFLAGKSHAQGLPPIYDQTKLDRYPVKKWVEYPVKTWMENLVQGRDGSFYLTNYPEGKVMKVNSEGISKLYAQVPGKIAGIARWGQAGFLLTGWDSAGRASIFAVDANQQVQKVLSIEGGQFPNGITPLSADKYLVADSYAGCIWLLDMGSKNIRVWVKDPLLQRFKDTDELPAANGLKLFRGNLYVTNTAKQLIVKIPVNGIKAGKPALYIDKVSGDDLCFDSKGNCYVAANVYNRVLKITADKVMTVIATLEDGAAGATAVCAVKDTRGVERLYVTTCGGMGVPPPSGIEAGKLLTIQLK